MSKTTREISQPGEGSINPAGATIALPHEPAPHDDPIEFPALPVERPPYRRLRVYAFDPTLSTQIDNASVNHVTIKVPWEYDPHTGRDILEPIRFLQPLIPGVHLHHERWDGKGYPLGLGGNDIPLIARIVAVADTYDAMTSDRAYRRALPHEVTIAEIERCCGTQFDRNVAFAFLEAIEEFRAQKLATGETIPE